MKKSLVIVLLLGLVALAFWLPGCGKEETGLDTTEGRPERVTAYDAVQYTKPKADNWQSENWAIQVREGDPDGLGRDGKAKIWTVYFFSPTPEEDSQLQVMYNRGNVWPSAPGKNKGGDDGREIYKKGKPPDFRVDSSEAYNVAIRNGGGDYKDAHPDARVTAVLRCKADYDSVGDKMPAPKYKWIWEVTFKDRAQTAESLVVQIDGMNGDFIAKESVKPAQ
ncbi:MAG: hypothetical protein KKF41_13420 [Actinobacteria bacterium]|nr:hypothetical protein [Actinomycetota bacterium]MBU2688577.1 hypothetical protein [Actinomycetota bacterium]